MVICNGDRIHRTGPGTHTAFADIPFQGRPGSACAADEIFPVTQHHFSVGADIQKQGGFLPLGQAGGQQAADDVPAQIVGGGGEAVNGPGNAKPQFPAPHQSRMLHHRAEGGMEQAEGIQSQQKVNHGGVTADDHGTDLLRKDSRLGADRIHKGIQGIHSNRLKLLAVLGIVLGVENPAEDFVTVGTLTVAHRILCQNAAGSKIHQPHHHCGTSQVHRSTITGQCGIPRLCPYNFPTACFFQHSDRKGFQPQNFIVFLHHRDGYLRFHSLCRQGIQAALDVICVVRIHILHGQASFLYPRVCHGYPSFPFSDGSMVAQNPPYSKERFFPALCVMTYPASCDKISA